MEGFTFKFKNYEIKYESGTLFISEFYEEENGEVTFLGSIEVSMNDIRDIQAKVNEVCSK